MSLQKAGQADWQKIAKDPAFSEFLKAKARFIIPAVVFFT